MTEKIDTSKLDPATPAKHLAFPEGEIGKAVIAEHNVPCSSTIINHAELSTCHDLRTF